MVAKKEAEKIAADTAKMVTGELYTVEAVFKGMEENFLQFEIKDLIGEYESIEVGVYNTDNPERLQDAIASKLFVSVSVFLEGNE